MFAAKCYGATDVAFRLRFIGSNYGVETDTHV